MQSITYVCINKYPNPLYIHLNIITLGFSFYSRQYIIIIFNTPLIICSLHDILGTYGSD